MYDKPRLLFLLANIALNIATVYVCSSSVGSHLLYTKNIYSEVNDAHFLLNNINVN